MRTRNLPMKLAVAGLLMTVGCAGSGGGGFPLPDPAAAVSSGFGPRLKASESFRYDFHRGVDLEAPFGTPVLAVDDGVVRIAGDHDAYDDLVVQVAHGPGGGLVCDRSPEACAFSTSMHLSDVAVAEGDVVRAGDVIGYSGISESGFEHLHFEIRQGGVWQRHAVDPLAWLGHGDAAAPVVEAIAPEGDDLRVVVSSGGSMPDLSMVHVDLIDDSGKPVRDHRVDVEAWNRAWTHTSTEWPAPGCAFADAHPDGSAYDPHVHLDDPEFNGVHVEPDPFRSDSDVERWTLVFEGLLAGVDGEAVAVEVRDAPGVAAFDQAALRP